MTEPTKSLLIVEDDRGLALMYAELAEGEGWTARVAHSLTDAEEQLERMAFAVAIVDLALRPEDTNRDGLRVLEAIRETGDPTARVLVTGHGDLDIGAAVVAKYDASAVSKKSFGDPSDGVPRLLEENFTVHRELRRQQAQSTHSALIDSRVELFRGDKATELWEYEMISKLVAPDGVSVLWNLCEKLFDSYMPAVGRANAVDSGLTLDDGSEIAVGEFWSRARGLAVGVILGSKPGIDQWLAAAQVDDSSVLDRAESKTLHGVVYNRSDLSRVDFRRVREGSFARR